MCIVETPMSAKMKRKLSELVDPMKLMKGEMRTIRGQLKDVEKAIERSVEAFERTLNKEHIAFEKEVRREIRRRETTESKEKLKAALDKLKGLADKGVVKRKRELHYANLWEESLQNDEVIKAKAHDFRKGFTGREEHGREEICAKYAMELSSLQERVQVLSDKILSRLDSDEDVTDDDDTESEEDASDEDSNDEGEDDNHD